MVGPPLLASGRDADVFAIDDDRVLRRYRNGGDVAAEATVMAYVAERGYPVPEVYEAAETDLVMERLDGPTMGQALIAGDLEVQQGGLVLADLHSRLHDLPARLDSDPGVRILHLDLHPENVMLSRRGPVVIDWRNATEGPPDLDLALSALIIAQVATDEARGVGEMATALMTAFLRHAGGDPLNLLDRAVEIRRADPALTGEEVDRLAVAEALVRAGVPR